MTLVIVEPHRCTPPELEHGYEDSLWRCDGCGRVWRAFCSCHRNLIHHGLGWRLGGLMTRRRFAREVDTHPEDRAR